MTVSGLNIKHLSKDSFINMLEHVIYDINIKKVFISDKKPIKTGRLSLTNEFRLDIPLSGRKHMTFASEGKIQDVLMKPGELHYCPPLHWKYPCWDYIHEMSSIVYKPTYIRFTYINFDHIDSFYDFHAASIYYHTARPLNEIGNSLLRTLNLLSKSPNKAGLVELINGLLKITLEELKRDEQAELSKGNLTKLNIEHYIQENFSSPINRAHIAKVFGLTPSYVSQLFMKNQSESLNQKLRRLRLEHAALLLKNSNMSIDEITDSCGYLSSTYFIAAFKKYYGISPGKYRRVNMQK